MKLYWFLITVIYDEGRFPWWSRYTLQVAARNIAEAIKTVMYDEGCPVSSIVKVAKGKRIGRTER